MSATFLQKKIFVDIENIKGGQDFPEVLHNTVANCDVILVIIGANWISTIDEEGRRRLDPENDFLRREVQTALECNKCLIPVLVDDVEMPASEQLPPALTDLSRKHAIQISNARFKVGYAELAKSIKKGLSDAERERNKNRPIWRNIGVAIGVVGAIAILVSCNIIRDWRANNSFAFVAMVAGFLLAYFTVDYQLGENTWLGHKGKKIITWILLISFLSFLGATASAMLNRQPRFVFPLLGLRKVQICYSAPAEAYSCGEGIGSHIISNVSWDDEDRGLHARVGPHWDAQSLGIIPAHATEVVIEQCDEQLGWCTVRCRDLKGWSRGKYLKARAAALMDVTGISPKDPDGLTARNGPSPHCGEAGHIPFDGHWYSCSLLPKRSRGR